MDAQGLKATLAQLTETMPAMSGHVGEAIDAGHAAFAAGDELAQRAVEVAEHSDQEVALAQQAMEEFTEFADDARGNLGQVNDQLEARAQELAELDTPLAAVDEAVGHVEESFSRVQGTLSTGAAGLDEASAATHEHLESLFGAITEGHQKLAGGVEEVTTAFKALQQGVQQGQEALAEDTDGLVHQVTGHQDALVDKVGGFLANSNDWMSSLSTDLTDTLPKLMQDPVNQALEEVHSKIHDQLQQLVRSAMDEVLGALDEFEAKINDAQKGSELSRELLKPLFQEIEELAKPLIESLDSIKDAGSLVGIGF
jgi:uncharacterized phage infection (PIP) family protein YhgE